MKQDIERRKPSGVKDSIALALTTFGVGYIPGAPGTYGSVVGVGIYHIAIFLVLRFHRETPYADGLFPTTTLAWIYAVIAVALLLFCLAGIWAADRSIELLGNKDPKQAVVDEVMGQLITFLFIPFTLSWQLILAGFLLFRLFDIWKPYPIDSLQDLPGGVGICADDILAGVYAGICLSVIYAIMLSV